MSSEASTTETGPILPSTDNQSVSLQGGSADPDTPSLDVEMTDHERLLTGAIQGTILGHVKRYFAALQSGKPAWKAKSFLQSNVASEVRKYARVQENFEPFKRNYRRFPDETISRSPTPETLDDVLAIDTLMREKEIERARQNPGLEVTSHMGENNTKLEDYQTLVYPDKKAYDGLGYNRTIFLTPDGRFLLAHMQSVYGSFGEDNSSQNNGRLLPRRVDWHPIIIPTRDPTNETQVTKESDEDETRSQGSSVDMTLWELV